MDCVMRPTSMLVCRQGTVLHACRAVLSKQGVLSIMCIRLQLLIFSDLHEDICIMKVATDECPTIVYEHACIC